jgi:DNA-binding IclR family transcriptional regulator
MKYPKRGYKSPSVLRAFKILEVIRESPYSYGISDISRILGIEKSTVHAIILALEEAGVIKRDSKKKKFALGEGLLKLIGCAYGQLRLRDIAIPFLKDLVELAGETSFVGILREDHLQIIGIEEGPGDMKITSHPGTILPMLAGATGKLILAHMEPQKAERIIDMRGLPYYTGKSIINKDIYLKEIDRVRKEGYAIDEGEYIDGVWAVASPIYNHGRMLGAIWVAGFLSRLNREKRESIIDSTLKASRIISSILDGIAFLEIKEDFFRGDP